MYEYLIGSLLFAAVWLVLYILRKDLRKKMIFASLLCMPLGLSEIFFVPWYWNPHRLFNLNPAIESLLFCFAVGGIASVLYEVVFKKHLRKAREKRIETKRHLYALAGVFIFSMIFFSFIFKKDLIYTAIISMALGSVTIMISRKDLIKETVLGGFLFLIVYFSLLYLLNTLIFPDIIVRVWNLEHLWGITFLKIPLEEILWAFTFGSLWAPIYEDLKGYAFK